MVGGVVGGADGSCWIVSLVGGTPPSQYLTVIHLTTINIVLLLNRDGWQFEKRKINQLISDF